MQQGIQGAFIKHLTHHNAAVGQAQMQQSCGAFGMQHFAGMLQNQYLNRAVHRLNAAANAGTLGP
jgi:hypothetical protein